MSDTVLYLASFIIGLIDSIAGGGGLIAVPTLGLALGPGLITIATNKILGTVAAGVAFAVYARKGHFDLKKGLQFGLWVGAGSIMGASIAFLVPTEAFKYLLLFTCPIFIYVLWKKDLWIKVQNRAAGTPLPLLKTAIVGVLIGFYDGMWGPGGGTLMLFGLLFVVKMPLLPALATGRFVNLISAGGSLALYTSAGAPIVWKTGSICAVFVSIGALIGARLASAKAALIVRPVMAIIVLGLIARTFWIS